MTPGLPTPARVLVVGGGGREHALAWKLANEPRIEEVVVAPGSDAIGMLPGVRCASGIAIADPGAVVAAAHEARADLVVIGPEGPLAAGAVDALAVAGIRAFGPSAAAARIESSKGFCRSIAEAVGVRMARGRSFDSLEAARAFAGELARDGDGVVVKVDGLAAGKGVTVCASLDEAHAALERIFAADTPTGGSATADGSPTVGPRVVVEERLTGREASSIVLFDGRTCLALPIARDHKRLCDGDTGPNTGGMGGFSPLPELTDADVERLVDTVHLPILRDLGRRGTPFRGALFAGIMLTADGPVLLECNARLGDPETQLVLPRLDTAIAPLLLATATGTLQAAAEALGLRGRLLPATRESSVGFVLAASGYPDRPRTGDRIDGLEDARSLGALVFHAGTTRDAAGGYRTNGGRVLTVVGLGSDLPAANQLADRAADAIAFDGRQRRHDFAWADGAVPIGAVG